jgi:hypothetical protein
MIFTVSAREASLQGKVARNVTTRDLGKGEIPERWYVVMVHVRWGRYCLFPSFWDNGLEGDVYYTPSSKIQCLCVCGILLLISCHSCYHKVYVE